MFAAAGVALASGLEPVDGLRLAVAAGALNATRSGLGSGIGEDIERIVKSVEVGEVAGRGG
jgi:fructose-1-phosphate kinase PfkB-like protein